MQKKWMLKYVLAIVLGVISAVVLSNWLRNPDGTVRWYVWLIPLVALSLVMVWRVIRRYVTLALAKVDVGDSAYNVLFRFILIIGGALLVVPLLVTGFVLAILHAIKEYTLARDDYELELKSRDSAREQDVEITDNSHGSQPLLIQAGATGAGNVELDSLQRSEQNSHRRKENE